MGQIRLMIYISSCAKPMTGCGYMNDIVSQLLPEGWSANSPHSS